MAERRIGIIMHGVTGRMGTNQHLLRSVLAIREEGGVALADGTRLLPDPLLVGRDPGKLEALADAHRIARWTQDLDAALADPDYELFFDAASTQLRASVLERAIAAGKHVYCEKPIAADLESALAVWRAAEAAGIRHGVVQDKLWLPGLQKLRMLIEAGFFGRILAVKGDFGYWVFEGDWQPAQRPSWNYRKEQGGGIILDMLCHWRYVLDNLFGAVEGVFCLGANHIPERVDERGEAYARRRRGCGLRHLPARRRHRRPDRQLLVHAGAPRRPRDLPGRRHPRLGGRGAHEVLHPAAGRDPAPGLEPGYRAHA